MVRLLRPLTRGTTYTRLVHLWVPMLLVSVWLFVFPGQPWGPALPLIPLGLIPAVRLGEGVQAQVLLTPGEKDPGFSVRPAATWGDRFRTVLWLEVRMVLGALAMFSTVWFPMLAYDFTAAAFGHAVTDNPLMRITHPHWAYGLLAPLCLVAMYASVVGLGELVTVVARRLLGPSAAERVAALEKRTEQLLERTRIARELHDSIGHALTVAVVQAGAARAAGDPAFTDRALLAIEDTGRAALEDLERVLGLLRETRRPASGRPTLVEADRLMESARTSGAKIDSELTGPLETMPGPVSREGYRILQECLTNVLRHAGPVPVRVRIAVEDRALTLEVRNPLTAGIPGSGPGGGMRGSGLRGIRERAALLGGTARTGPDGGDWQVHVELPLR
ncbi:histidine kinase [Streptomyces tauricus]|uniref:histidine kinase n=1 Tax=Streptomyces tauricus TaxID=68274 RepID=A0ABZ1JNN3_9ACTN|nr:histidine kinase [Streptomyces tauricus]